MPEFIGRVSPRKQGGKVYRGMSGVLLPEKFRVPDEEGCRGGVERGFLSTSTSKEQALAYIDMSKGMCDFSRCPAPPYLSLSRCLQALLPAGRVRGLSSDPGAPDALKTFETG